MGKNVAMIGAAGMGAYYLKKMMSNVSSACSLQRSS